MANRENNPISTQQADMAYQDDKARQWTHDTPTDLSPNNYARAMSYMYVAKFTDMCIDRCRIVVPGEIHGDLTNGDRACIDSCFKEIKHNYSQIYTEYKDAVGSFFTE